MEATLGWPQHQQLNLPEVEGKRPKFYVEIHRSYTITLFFTNVGHRLLLAQATDVFDL